MADFCQSLKVQDTSAYSLCEDLVKRGETKKSLDRGVTRLDYSKENKPTRLRIGKDDGKISAPEVYDRYLELVEAEETKRVKQAIKNPDKVPKFNSLWLQRLNKLGNTQVPWIFDDLDPKTKSDEKLFKLSIKKIYAIKEDLRSQGVKEGSPNFQKKLAIALFGFLKASKKKGGLGIKYYQGDSRSPRNLGGIYAHGEATCLEFVRIYYALGRAAGLDVVPIEVFRNEQGKLLEHVRIAIRYDPKDPKKLFFLDLEKGVMKDSKKGVWTELSSLDLLAYFYNAQGTVVAQKSAGDYFKQALGYSPSQYMVLGNYGMWLLRSEGSVTDATGIFQKACKTNPFYPFLYKGLAEAYQKQGKTKKAQRAKKKAKELF